MSEHDDVLAVIDEGRFRTVFQPIYGLETRRVTAVEALTRFAGQGRPASPAHRFAQARALGLDVELELATLRRALASATRLPAGVSLSVNLSPRALLDVRAVLLLTRRQVGDLTVEITEQATASGYPDLLRVRGQLRDMGIRVAIDDVGVSVASVRHVGWLAPDVVKADLSLTHGLAARRSCRLLARYLLLAARRAGASVVAEGVETPAQLQAWRRLGADAVQGFLLAAPGPLEDALAASPLTPGAASDRHG